jgi:RNA polymerase sigma factor (sigma-70 family)
MPDWSSETDDRVLCAAARDAEAFACFYRRYEALVLAFFVRRVRDVELAADLTAEVFAAALVSCGRFRAGGAPASAWLFGIARHTLSRSRRRGVVEDRARRRLGMSVVAVDDADLERVERAVGSEEAVERWLEAIPTDQREAVRARVLEERSYEEVARQLRCSSAVARKRVSRGLAHLRKQMVEDGS